MNPLYCNLQLDATVEIIRQTQPQFYTGYVTARKVVETGVGSLRVKGQVSDTLTGEPIAEALLEFALVIDLTADSVAGEVFN